MCVCTPSIRTPWCDACRPDVTLPMPKCKPAKVATEDLMEELIKRFKQQTKAAHSSMTPEEFISWLDD